jgi:hypothetical protein
MSDKSSLGTAWGNLSRQWSPEEEPDRNISSYPSRRPLVEETLFVNMRDLQRIHEKALILKAADEGRPIPVLMEGHYFQVYLSWAPHRLPGKPERWSDISQGNCRIYFICPSCRRRIRILFKNPRPMVSDLPPIGCKRCLRLVYASENSCKRKWWKHIVRPLRRLYRRREKLLSLNRTFRVVEELRRTEELIFIYTKRAELKHRNHAPSGVKRPYKNVRLALCLYSDCAHASRPQKIS